MRAKFSERTEYSSSKIKLLLHGLNACKFNSDLSRDYVEHEENESRSFETDGNSLSEIGFKTNVNCTISSNIQ